MTDPLPLPTEPLLTPERLGQWAQEVPLLDSILADLVIDAVTTLLRQYGDSYWTLETLPKRASDIAYVVAKDYYLNPTQLLQETTGPLQESRAKTVLQGLNFTEEQKEELAALAAGQRPAQRDGLFTQGFTRGPVETHSGAPRGTVVVWDTREAWPIEYLDTEDAVVFLEPVF